MAIKRNLFRDILRDTNSKKYSLNKVTAFTVLLMLVAAVGTALAIMIINKEVDHILIGELIFMLLTLLGFKNFKGNFNSIAGTVDPVVLPAAPDEIPETDHLVEEEDKDSVG